MRFGDLDAKMRVYETIRDQWVVPGNYTVARIDGRNFSKLTRADQFEKPFSKEFHEMMVQTTRHLMDCGFKIVYGYTQSDEISLLLDIQDDTFGRKYRKLNSIFAGEASGKFSILLGRAISFDCRLSALPNYGLVVDYFRWRQEDSTRNALTGYCYWKLRQSGLTATQATKQMSGMTVSEKKELLHARFNINFDTVTPWQKRGTGLYYVKNKHIGYDPIGDREIVVLRRKLITNEFLPYGDGYTKFMYAFE